MDMLVLAFAATVGILLYSFIRYRGEADKRSNFIQTYQFPSKVFSAVGEQYPHLSDDQINQVIQGLRDYFHICQAAGKEFVSMPSEAVDTAWHQFILFTRDYEDFCQNAFGRFLHHTPAEGMGSAKQAREGIKAAWRLSCNREKIKPASPGVMPLLFALDASLNIENGHAYVLDCEATPVINGQATHCVTHLKSSTSGASCGASGSQTSVDGDGASGCGSCGGCGS